MTRWTTWLLPVVLVAAQFALWPREPIPAWEAFALATTSLVIGAALLWRRTRPVTALVVVGAGIAAGAVAGPDESLLVLGGADIVALFSVAVRRPGRVTVIALGGTIVLQSVVSAVDEGVDGDYPYVLMLIAGIYAVVAALGRRRGRWIRARAEAVRRLAEAQEAERSAAAAERGRLARELHDVTAHHLTSIVINASAAEMLAAQRPELRPEALTFAARTGRDALTALHRLVEMLPADELPPDPTPDLPELAEAFRRLGQPVTTELPPGDPPPGIAVAAHGIAREALTNTLRYAPGRPVRLILRYGVEHAELVIDDDGRPDGPAVTGLGGGHGVTGMRARAAAVGGTLSAGRRDDGGWRVRAILPLGVVAGPARRQWSPVVLDLMLIALLLLLPLTGVAEGVTTDGVTAAGAVLVTLAAIAHTAPLLWRRTHPWAVLAATMATSWLGPLLVGLYKLPAWLFILSAAAEFAAVHSVAAWGRRPVLTWLGAAASALSSALVIGALAVLEPPDTPGLETVDAAGRVAVAGFLAAAVALVLAVPAGLSWLAGFLARRRRERRQVREEWPVHVALSRAADHARGERSRVAAGLREAVLQHAAQVPAAAERSDLPAVVAAARHALAAMRALLDGLTRAASTTPPIAPADPTASVSPPARPPASGPPASGPPVPGSPASGPSVPGSPASGSSVLGASVPGAPASGSPVSGPPASGSPASGSPVSGPPASGPPASEANSSVRGSSVPIPPSPASTP
jgi:signal transduction histidine kinase